MRLTVLHPLSIILGFFLLIFVILPLLPLILVIVLLFLIFGKKVSMRKRYEQFRDSRFYGARMKEEKPDDPDVCDVECTVISSETVDDKK